MKMSKLSNQTNSQDPQAVNSRVFVGNLNTFQCSKTDVERMFQRYGKLAGISMHKGYAFVQFTNPFDARNACHGEDGRNVLSQVLDCNLVAEPKVNILAMELSKRQNTTKTGNDWDYYYDSYYASTLFPVNAPRAVKRQRLSCTSPQSRAAGIISPQNQVVLQAGPQVQQLANGNLTTATNLLQLQQQQQIMLPVNLIQNQNYINNGFKLGKVDNNDCVDQQTPATGPFKVYSNPDILICGNCREMFSELNEMLNHKRNYCKLRFTCKCQDQLPNIINKNLYPSSKLLCVVCKDSFSNPWDLLVHAQMAHMVNIYQIGDSDEEDDSNLNNKSNKLDKTNGESHNGSSCNGTAMQSNENDMELNTPTSEKNHSSSTESTPTNELLLDNELIINTNGKLSADLSPDKNMFNNFCPNISPNENDLTSSSRSTSPSDKENGMDSIDSPPRACIMRALSIDTKNVNPNLTALALSSLANGTTAQMATQ